MKTIKFGKSVISEDGPCYVIAEIGHNHQGKLETAFEMIETAAQCGVQAVKFQKRDNKALYTKALYNKRYDSENSYGDTYGEHREHLEFGEEEHKQLRKCAEENGVEYLCTAFDLPSVDFLEKLGVGAYKIASGDLTNLPLLTYVAKLGKPMIVSTGAATLEEIRMAYETILKHNGKLCFLHCVASYPAEYDTLNLRFVTTLKEKFPKAVVGYSGHDNGILAPVIAHMLGAIVIEKHFTMCHAWKGTDNKFSLEPIGLKKMVRDLNRVRVSLGSGVKELQEFEKAPREKMGKSIYASRALTKGTVLTQSDVCLKSPGSGLMPYQIDRVIGKRLRKDLEEEAPLCLEDLE